MSQAVTLIRGLQKKNIYFFKGLFQISTKFQPPLLSLLFFLEYLYARLFTKPPLLEDNSNALVKSSPPSTLFFHAHVFFLLPFVLTEQNIYIYVPCGFLLADFNSILGIN